MQHLTHSARVAEGMWCNWDKGKYGPYNALSNRPSKRLRVLFTRKQWAEQNKMEKQTFKAN
jgi:hypothetical protein